MAAVDHAQSKQWRQLPMFLSASEIQSQYDPLDGDRRWERKPGSRGMEQETSAEMYARKLAESKKSRPFQKSLHADIQKNGVENPVSLALDGEDQITGMPTSRVKPQVLGGHHRVAVMADLNPHALIPVEHFKSYTDARNTKKDKY
jgi:hypothetical protein